MKPIKCLVVSDTHGRVDLLRRAVLRHRGVDAVIFLGDGLSDLEDVLCNIGKETAVLAVRGNCDFSHEYLDRRIYKVDAITLGGKKLVLTHGDLYGVKYGMDGVIGLAEQMNADVVLYGHTHIRSEEYIDGVYYLNPGSLCGRGVPPTAALLTIADGGVLFSFMEL